MFRGASIYDHEQPPGWRVLIMRYWPRGVRRDRVDTWLRDAAPTVPLLRAYRDKGIDWTEFATRYRDEILRERPHVIDQLRALEREHGDVVLLCTERIPPDEHCHRLTLIELLPSSEPSPDSTAARFSAVEAAIPRALDQTTAHGGCARLRATRYDRNGACRAHSSNQCAAAL